MEYSLMCLGCETDRHIVPGRWRCSRNLEHGSINRVFSVSYGGTFHEAIPQSSAVTWSRI
jgi:hypothetical protein